MRPKPPTVQTLNLERCDKPKTQNSKLELMCVTRIKEKNDEQDEQPPPFLSAHDEPNPMPTLNLTP